MRSRIQTPRSVAVPALLALALASPVLADTWTVDDDGPADFSTIQAAIDAAQSGDVILVAPGSYTGTKESVIDFSGKDLEIIGSGFDTKVDGQQGRRGALVDCGPGATPLLEGFLFLNCLATGDGGGVRVTSAAVRVEDCTFQACEATGRGGGLFIESCADARLAYLDFVDCRSSQASSSLYVTSSTVLGLDEVSVDSDPQSGSGFYFLDSLITGTPPGAGSVNLCAFARVEPALVLNGSILEGATEFTFTDVEEGPAVVLEGVSSAGFDTSTWRSLDVGIEVAGTDFSLVKLSSLAPMRTCRVAPGPALATSSTLWV